MTGFGGDGDPTTPITVGRGHCVTDGPFSQLRPIIYNHTYIDHCLSRGFQNNGTRGLISGEPFSPDAVGNIIRKPTFREFGMHVEYSLHNSMHTAISGDFLALTAANGESNIFESKVTRINT